MYNSNPPIAPDEARALVRLLQRHNYKVTLDESDRQAPGDLFADTPGIAPASQVLADTGVSIGNEDKGISLADLGDEKPARRPRRHLKGAAKAAWVKKHYGSKRAMMRHMHKILKLKRR
jgi:hypothetical protein